MKKVERALYQSKYKSIYGVPVAEKKKKKSINLEVREQLKKVILIIGVNF